MSRTIEIESKDEFLFRRGEEIIELLRRAQSLGFSLVVTPDEANTLISILENARLQKLSKDAAS